MKLIVVPEQQLRASWRSRWNDGFTWGWLLGCAVMALMYELGARAGNPRRSDGGPRRADAGVMPPTPDQDCGDPSCTACSRARKERTQPN